MFNAKPPFRLAVGAVLLDGVPRTPAEVLNALRPDYTGERLATLPNVEEQLQALKAVGVVKIAAEALGEEGELVQTYIVSDYGRDKVQRNL